MDSKLQDHTEFIGLYSVDSIDAKSLVASIKNVFLCMGLPLSNCTENLISFVISKAFSSALRQTFDSSMMSAIAKLSV